MSLTRYQWIKAMSRDASITRFYHQVGWGESDEIVTISVTPHMAERIERALASNT